jgi:hypothetical protein
MTSGSVFGTGGRRSKLVIFSLLIKLCWQLMRRNANCGMSGRLNGRLIGRRGRMREGRARFEVLHPAIM